MLNIFSYAYWPSVCQEYVVSYGSQEHAAWLQEGLESQQESRQVFVICFAFCFCLPHPRILSFSLSVPVSTSSTKPLLSKMTKLVFVLPFMQPAQIRTETSWSHF